MRLAIYGCGGVGGYYGARLAKAGHEVIFIARGDHLEAMRRDGLRVKSVFGDVHLPQVKAVENPGDAGEVDFVLIAVKAWQLQEVTSKVQPLLGPNTAVVTLQNGVDAPHQVAALIGKQRVLPGIAKIFAFISGPGCIDHIGGPASLAFGEWNNQPSERTERLRAALTGAGVTVDTPHDILAALWMKFLLVSSFGGVGAVSRAPIGVMRTIPETRALIERCMTEIAEIASTRGVALPERAVATMMTFLDSQPVSGTSSLQRDIAAGRRSELDAWNGAAVRLALESGTVVPVNTFIYHSLLPLERRAQGQVEFDLSE